jgi:inhibitor of KinA
LGGFSFYRGREKCVKMLERIVASGGDIVSGTSCEFYPLGDCAAAVRFGTSIDLTIHRKVRQLAACLKEKPLPGMVEFVPAFTAITVYYDPLKTDYEAIRRQLERIVGGSLPETVEGARRVDIPVCYGGELGPDLSFVAEHSGLNEEEVIRIHSGSEYIVYMLGFSPGFPYLGGMSERIAVPRMESPRMAVPEGAVGIAGKQTGIYSLKSPGGWRIIGRTPLKLFRPDTAHPTLLQAGDIVRFRPVSLEEYERLRISEGADHQ